MRSSDGHRVGGSLGSDNHWRALNSQAQALCDLAEVLNAAGKRSEAETALTQALERFERKMNLAQAAQTRARRAEIQQVGPR